MGSIVISPEKGNYICRIEVYIKVVHLRIIFIKCNQGLFTGGGNKMKKIIWDDEFFDVGHEILNKQHKKIIELLNQLSADTDETISTETFYFKFKELQPYLKQHLKYEERLLEDIGYAGIEAHKEVHASYLGDMAKYMKFAEANAPDQRSEIKLFLFDWWRSHILEEDMQYKKHF